jgi:hypothetical protein
MKIALCFIINYQHILNKEEIWREWIEPNKDKINIYFYYKDLNKIKSKWILKYCLPEKEIFPTTYTNIIPAYLSLMNYAIKQDNDNKWFCFLTESCCPIISPKKFINLFNLNNNFSIFSWKKAWWNPYYNNRGNLAKLSSDLWLGNSPYFILTKKNILQILSFVKFNKNLTKLIINGGIANECLFAIIFKFYNDYSSIINSESTITDWSRMMSSTSPYLFRKLKNRDIEFINNYIEKNKMACFIRKIAPEFPDEILKYYINNNI